MPSPSNTQPKTGLVIDRATHTIRLTRDLDAPRDAIFAAWTRPEHVSLWWDAGGKPLAVCEIDLRPGGAFRFVTRGHPDMPFVGTYREITPPDRLVFDAIGAVGRITLEDCGSKTHMIAEIVCRSAEDLDQFLKMGVDVGTAQTLDNLVAYARRETAFVE